MERHKQYYNKEFYESTKLFDCDSNYFALSIIKEFNDMMSDHPDYSGISIDRADSGDLKPEQVIWVDASNDGLPATREACRVAGLGIIVNTREELKKEFCKNADNTLVLSQCVDSKCYDVCMARDLERSGGVTSPGEITAPGSIFSNKAKTYDMLSKNKTDWSLVARYNEISPYDKTVRQVAGLILDAADEDALTDNFFVKPTQGGGGLGGFRLLRSIEDGKNKYVIPDLSKLTGKAEVPKITNLTLDPYNKDVIEGLWWLYERFRSIEQLRSAYIDIDIKDKDSMRELLLQRTPYRKISREEALQKLVAAITDFEKKFDRRYHPIVNHYIDFGVWGLRAHYRLTTGGIELETIYARLFQVRFEQGGIGYVGSDNISNKQTGQLELGRLVPVNEVMVRSIGGKGKLLNVLEKGAKALRELISTQQEPLRRKCPIRVQFDLAPVSGAIGEGNADTARGFCLAQNWDDFKVNTLDWLDDSIAYYSYRKIGDRR